MILGLLGLAMVYSTIHLFVLQRKVWNNLTTYERTVSLFAIVSISLLYLGVMFGE